MITISTAGVHVTITAAIMMILVWFVVQVSDLNKIVLNLSNEYAHALFILDEPFPPVENVTVTNVGPTYLTVHWEVSAE